MSERWRRMVRRRDSADVPGWLLIGCGVAAAVYLLLVGLLVDSYMLGRGDASDIRPLPRIFEVGTWCDELLHLREDMGERLPVSHTAYRQGCVHAYSGHD